jgi:hypothetical protein
VKLSRAPRPEKMVSAFVVAAKRRAEVNGLPAAERRKQENDLESCLHLSQT